MGYKNDRLLEFLPWARGFARACAAKLPSHLDRDDLQSAGVVGYLRAASRYDVSKGASFRGFCAVRIRGAVLDELRRWEWAPRSVHKNKRRITRVTSLLMEQLDREPTSAELAEAMGINVFDLMTLQTQSQSRQLISFDEAGENYQGEENLALTERLPDPCMPTPDEVILSEEDKRTLFKCVGSLPGPQVTVIVLHYLQNIPLRDVAVRLKVTPSRVSQLHHQALGRLRQSWTRSESES